MGAFDLKASLFNAKNERIYELLRKSMELCKNMGKRKSNIGMDEIVNTLTEIVLNSEKSEVIGKLLKSIHFSKPLL